jgi:hypothetical protein
MLRPAQKRGALRPNDGELDIEVQNGPGVWTLVLCVGFCLLVLMAAVSQNLPALASMVSRVTGGASRSRPRGACCRRGRHALSIAAAAQAPRR